MKKKTAREASVDKELLAKGKRAVEDFESETAFSMKPKKRKTKLISIRIPVDMMSRLRAVAAERRDVGYQQVIKDYIAKGLADDEREREYWRHQLQEVRLTATGGSAEPAWEQEPKLSLIPGGAAAVKKAKDSWEE